MELETSVHFARINLRAPFARVLHPRRSHPFCPSSHLLHTLTSQSGFLKTPKNESIAFVHLPAEAGMPTILYSHGNTEDLAHSSQLYEELHTRGLGVFAYDYPGYGLSTGTPNEDSCQRAIQSSWNHLTKIGISTSSIIITGRSVGSGPSVWLASNQKPSALILISPFRSAFTTAIPTPFRYSLVTVFQITNASKPSTPHSLSSTAKRWRNPLSSRSKTLRRQPSHY